MPVHSMRGCVAGPLTGGMGWAGLVLQWGVGQGRSQQVLGGSAEFVHGLCVGG